MIAFQALAQHLFVVFSCARRCSLIVRDDAGDPGGQRPLRSAWRNYCSDQTDSLIWVVDSTDRKRMYDSREELTKLLHQPVRDAPPRSSSLVDVAVRSRNSLARRYSSSRTSRTFPAGCRPPRSPKRACTTPAPPPRLPDLVSPAQELNLRAIGPRRKYRVQPCSALTGEDLEIGLDWVVEEVAGRLGWGDTPPHIKRQRDEDAKKKGSSGGVMYAFPP